MKNNKKKTVTDVTNDSNNTGEKLPVANEPVTMACDNSSYEIDKKLPVTEVTNESDAVAEAANEEILTSIPVSGTHSNDDDYFPDEPSTSYCSVSDSGFAPVSDVNEVNGVSVMATEKATNTSLATAEENTLSPNDIVTNNALTKQANKLPIPPVTNKPPRTPLTAAADEQKAIDELKDKMFNEKMEYRFKPLHDAYIKRIEDYKKKYGDDNFIQRQRKWYAASKKYFCKKPLGRIELDTINYHKETFNFVDTVEKLIIAINRLCDCIDKLKAQGFNTEEALKDRDKFFSSQKRRLPDLWDALAKMAV